MEDFFWIILVVAAIILILSMTFVGVVMYTSTSAAVFPPRANACPDYWVVGNSSGNVTCKLNTSKNKGNYTSNITAGTIPSSADAGGSDTIYSADAKWANWSKYPGKTGFCAKQAWAVNNGITWDGVSNSNVC